jgi:hypothetical protein
MVELDKSVRKTGVAERILTIDLEEKPALILE